MPTARDGLAAAAPGNGKLYAVGGEDGSRVLATCEEFDPNNGANGTWTAKTSMNYLRVGLAAAAPGNGRLYAVGGFNGGSFAACEEYTPSSAVSETTIVASQIQSYPNPFSQSTTISFTSPESGAAEVSVVNLLGSEVARLYSGELAQGKHSFTWNPQGAAQGMYECVVRMNGHVERASLVRLP